MRDLTEAAQRQFGGTEMTHPDTDTQTAPNKATAPTATPARDISDRTLHPKPRRSRRYDPIVFASGTAIGIGTTLWLLTALGWITP